jgi:hypothetical protein
MTEDLIIKAINDLSNAIKGSNNLGNDTKLEASTQLTTALQPGNKLPLGQASNHAPRVQIDVPPRVQIDTPPRVLFNTEENQEHQFNVNTAPQSIVESPTVST